MDPLRAARCAVEHAKALDLGASALRLKSHLEVAGPAGRQRRRRYRARGADNLEAAEDKRGIEAAHPVSQPDACSLLSATGRDDSAQPEYLILATRGRKTGREISKPLSYVEDGGRFYLVASYGGSDSAQASYLNLAANPEVKVQIGWSGRICRARILTSQEAKPLWPKLFALYPAYADYQKKNISHYSNRRTHAPLALADALLLDRLRAVRCAVGDAKHLVLGASALRLETHLEGTGLASGQRRGPRRARGADNLEVAADAPTADRKLLCGSIAQRNGASSRTLAHGCGSEAQRRRK